MTGWVIFILGAWLGGAVGLVVGGIFGARAAEEREIERDQWLRRIRAAEARYGKPADDYRRN